MITWRLDIAKVTDLPPEPTMEGGDPDKPKASIRMQSGCIENIQRPGLRQHVLWKLLDNDSSKYFGTRS